MLIDRLRLNLQDALRQPVQDVNDPEVLIKLRRDLLRRIRPVDEAYQQWRARSAARARQTFIR